MRYSTAPSSDNYYIQGNSNVGSLVGGVDYMAANSDVTKTISMAFTASTINSNVIGNSNVGGWFGSVNGANINVSNYNTNKALPADTAYSANGYYATSIQATGNNIGGVFGYMSDSSTSGNMYVFPTINATSSNYLGGAIGYAVNTDVANIHINGSASSKVFITGQNYIGGIAGYYGRDDANKSATMSNCGILYISITGDSIVGGIIGQCVNANVSNVTNDTNSTIDGNQYVGGVIGYLYSSNDIAGGTSGQSLNITNDQFTPVIKNIVGADPSATPLYAFVSNITNNANVTGSKYVGGVVGYTNRPVLDKGSVNCNANANQTVIRYNGVFDKGTLNNEVNTGRDETLPVLEEVSHNQIASNFNLNQFFSSGNVSVANATFVGASGTTKVNYLDSNVDEKFAAFKNVKFNSLEDAIKYIYSTYVYVSAKGAQSNYYIEQYFIQEITLGTQWEYKYQVVKGENKTDQSPYLALNIGNILGNAFDDTLSPTPTQNYNNTDVDNILDSNNKTAKSVYGAASGYNFTYNTYTTQSSTIRSSLVIRPFSYVIGIDNDSEEVKLWRGAESSHGISLAASVATQSAITTKYIDVHLEELRSSMDKVFTISPETYPIEVSLEDSTPVATNVGYQASNNMFVYFSNFVSSGDSVDGYIQTTSVDTNSLSSAINVLNNLTFGGVRRHYEKLQLHGSYPIVSYVDATSVGYNTTNNVREYKAKVISYDTLAPAKYYYTYRWTIDQSTDGNTNSITNYLKDFVNTEKDSITYMRQGNSTGCAATCFAMVGSALAKPSTADQFREIVYQDGINWVNPADMCGSGYAAQSNSGLFRYWYGKGYIDSYYDTKGITSTYREKFVSEYGFDWTYSNTKSDLYRTSLKDYINQGYILIVKFVYGSNSANTHFIIIEDIVGDNVMIADPAKNEQRKVSFSIKYAGDNLDGLLSATDSYYTNSKLVGVNLCKQV